MTYLNSIADQQAQPTQNTEADITHFLEYAANNTTAVDQFKASDMVLHIDIYVSYLSKPQPCSLTWGNYYLRSLPTDPKKLHTSHPQKMDQSTQKA